MTKKKKKVNKNENNPELFDNHEQYRLIDLFNSKFEMSPTDADYKLNHD